MGRAIAYTLLVLGVLLIVLGQDCMFAAEDGTVSATVTTTPLALSVSAPDRVRLNRHFVVKATVRNRGQSEITNVKAAIHLPDGLTLVTPEAEQDMGVIRAGRKKTVRWRVQASEAGTYVILVTASGQHEGDAVEAEATSTVEVRTRSSLWQSLLEILSYLSSRSTK